MYTRILKKESSLRALPLLVILFGLGFMGQSCRAMDPPESEPLVGSNGTINGALKEENGRVQSDVAVMVGTTLVAIDVPQNLKILLDSKEAVTAVTDANLYLYYADLIAAGDDGLEQLEELFQDEKSLNRCTDKSQLGEILLERARKGLDSKGPLQEYLRKQKTQNESLIGKLQVFEEQNAILQSSLSVKNIKIDEANIEINCLKKTKTILCVCLPLACIIVGGSAWALTWYLGRD